MNKYYNRVESFSLNLCFNVLTVLSAYVKQYARTLNKHYYSLYVYLSNNYKKAHLINFTYRRSKKEMVRQELHTKNII